MTRLAALNRFGLGVRYGELARLSDPQGWLLSQLEGASPARALPPGTGPQDIRDALAAFRRATQAQDPAARAEARRAIGQVAIREGTSALTLRSTSERPFVERLIAFWSDHLCVSLSSKAIIAPMAGSYERDVIRRHVLGSFSSMLLASARHPAMLAYLDNAQSVGPRSRAGLRVERGLNENYARELLELHTLGVDGGYTQQDVTELARLLTGWSFDGANGERALAFRFTPLRHEPGRKTVLGVRYGDGEAEGARAIRALAAHPKTAQHLAFKLARHFVSDAPPAALTAALAKSFQDSEGDLREMARTLVRHPESWRSDARKFRTPQDWVVAVLRATEVGVRDGGDRASRGIAALDVLRQLRQPLWGPLSPKGFGDLEREWADPDSLLNRAELARTIGRRVQTNPRAVQGLASLLPDDVELQTLMADGSIPLAERAALVLAGPSFQWR
jgi:uncharacterized protein (DUF1800 family)